MDSLQVDGAEAQRRQANLNFHEGNEARVQRLFISMEADNYVRLHFHPDIHKVRSFLVLRGSFRFSVLMISGAFAANH